MCKCKDQCARCPYYFALYGTVGILIWKLLFASYRLSNYIQSKAITWQACIYKDKSFISNHFSLISHCTKWCMWALGSGIKLSYLFKTDFVFIWYEQGWRRSTFTNKQRKYLTCICKCFKCKFRNMQGLWLGAGSVDVTFAEWTFPVEKKPVCSSSLQAEGWTLYKFLSSRSCFSKVWSNFINFHDH